MAAPYNSLGNCLSSLRESVRLLDDSYKVLYDSTKDVSRTKKVLLTKRVFGLIPESDLKNAKVNFKGQIEPQLSSLLSTIDRELVKLNKRKVNLQNKYDLQAVRLSGSTSSSNTNTSTNIPLDKISKVDSTKLSRLKFLRNKKERLKYSLSRLNLQDKKSRLSVTPSLPHPDNLGV
ncbi:DASH complex subunit Spc19 [Scheffersomyces amazonensis]|uniref:DASH complex subunit Spc19 n=1 Tax=Scheffersomyces amazonensis TaxID=1078765 RepID=UPI00315D3ADE